MAGLDQIKSFEDGGATGDTEAPLAAVQAKAVQAKGPYALATPTSGVSYDPSLLQKMEEIIKQKEAQQNSLLSGLQDATAWWSGGAAGPGEALARRADQRAQQQAELFGLQSQLSQAKTAQERAQAMQRANELEIGGGMGGGAGGAGGAGGGAGAYDFLTPAAKKQYQYLNKFVGPEAANAYLQKIVSKNQEIESGFLANPSAYEQKKVWNAEKNQYELINPIQQRAQLPQMRAQVQAQGQPTVSGGLNVGNIRTVESGGNPNAVSAKGAQGAMQVMPNTQANPGFGVTPARDNSPDELARVGEDYFGAMQKKYGNDTLAAIAYNMGPAATDAWIKGGAQFNKLPAETQQYIGKVHHANAVSALPVSAPAASAQPVISGGAPAAQQPGAVKPMAPLPPAPKAPQPLSGSNLPAFQQADIAAKTEEAGLTAEQKPIREKAGERAAALTDLGSQTGEVKRNADLIINTATNKPHLYGLGEKGDLASMAIHGAEAVPLIGKLGARGMEKLIAQGKFDEKDLATRRDIDSAANRLQIDFAKQAFQGSRMQKSFLDLAEQAKGVGTANPAETNRINATLIRSAAEMVDAKKEAWKQYRDTYGENVSFEKFENSPEYKRIEEDTQAKLAKKFPGYFGNEEAAPKSKFDKFRKPG